MNILDKIAMATKERVLEQKKKIAIDEMIKKAAEELNNQQKQNIQKESFAAALKKTGLSFICEVKKASPSKGVIAEVFPYLDIAKEYEKAGASAISVLTEPFFFQGSNEYLLNIADTVTIPVLRKDFIVDEYQIYEAKTLHASAILLICAILNDEQLSRYIEIAKSLKLDALVEAHDEDEVRRAIKAGAKIIGVNNRDLKTFTVDIKNSIRLRELVPQNITFISESGIETAQDIKELSIHGVDGVLIGETLMRAPDKKAALNQLRGQ